MDRDGATRGALDGGFICADAAPLNSTPPRSTLPKSAAQARDRRENDAEKRWGMSGRHREFAAFKPQAPPIAASSGNVTSFPRHRDGADGCETAPFSAGR